jgi:cytochrome c-type biogenesis protein CcmH/NrfG
MTVVLISGGLTFVVGLLILRPLSASGSRLHVGLGNQDDVRRRELLRQLRDLDDDLAAGKLTQPDHARLRGPVERAAVAALHQGPREPKGAVPLELPEASEEVQPGQPKVRGAAWTVRLLALAAVATSVAFLLINAVSSRSAGQAITGDSIPGVSSSAGNVGTTAPASQSGRKSPTAAQLAAVAAAQAQVKQNPKSVNAHLALAAAYTAAGAHQLAVVEYLAVARLDPTNAEANTSLALLAFQVGHAVQGKAMVDRVLAANPNYPEALYVRGLINLIGLRRAGPAARDFSAYLNVAPFGSHRTDAVTLLALAVSQEHR